jgi:hypothetical protein
LCIARLEGATEAGLDGHGRIGILTRPTDVVDYPTCASTASSTNHAEIIELYPV